MDNIDFQDFNMDSSNKSFKALFEYKPFKTACEEYINTCVLSHKKISAFSSSIDKIKEFSNDGTTPKSTRFYNKIKVPDSIAHTFSTKYLDAINELNSLANDELISLNNTKISIEKDKLFTAKKQLESSFHEYYKKIKTLYLESNLESRAALINDSFKDLISLLESDINMKKLNVLIKNLSKEDSLKAKVKKVDETVLPPFNVTSTFNNESIDNYLCNKINETLANLNISTNNNNTKVNKNKSHFLSKTTLKKKPPFHKKANQPKANQPRKEKTKEEETKFIKKKRLNSHSGVPYNTKRKKN